MEESLYLQRTASQSIPRLGLWEPPTLCYFSSRGLSLYTNFFYWGICLGVILFFVAYRKWKILKLIGFPEAKSLFPQVTLNHLLPTTPSLSLSRVRWRLMGRVSKNSSFSSTWNSCYFHLYCFIFQCNSNTYLEQYNSINTDIKCESSHLYPVLPMNPTAMCARTSTHTREEVLYIELGPLFIFIALQILNHSTKCLRCPIASL